MKNSQPNLLSAAYSGDRVLTVEDLSRMFNVSTKTISRWRDHGLEGGTFIISGRSRVGFLKTSVDRFARENSKRVERGASFRKLTKSERHQIVELARQLVRDGQAQSNVIQQVAGEMDCNAETVRYTIKKSDAENPDRAVFTGGPNPLSDAVKRQIYHQYRRGTCVEALSKRFGQSSSRVRTVVRQMRADRVLQLPLDYMHSDEFEGSGADRLILGPTPQPNRTLRKVRAPSGLPPYLASLYEVPLLTKDQEVHLFRKYNYLKCRASKLRDKLDPVRPKVRLLDEIEALYQQAVEMKNHIVRANLRLVVSIAKKYVQQPEALYNQVSDGNVSLMKAVEKFDYTRGFKFSTYATWAIKKNYARFFAAEAKHRERFRNSQEETLDYAAERRTNPYELENAQQRRVTDVTRVLRCLTERERRVIKQRFGLNGYNRPHTLKEIGADLGVSKERIRQIETHALVKLRKAAAFEKIETPFG